MKSDMAVKTRPIQASQARRLLPWFGSGAAVAALGLGLWLGVRPHPAPRRAPAHAGPRLVYSAQGYGGFVPAPAPVKTAARREAVPDPVQPVRDAYNAGHYRQVEAEAAFVVAGASGSRDVTRRRQAVEARTLMAYAAARRHDLPLARTRFAVTRREAARLPDRGKQVAQSGQNAPTMEEDAAYQHAVCTAALGDKAGAEAEYVSFMRAYPESPLVQGAVKRIGMLHGGDVPPAAQAVWQQAGATALTRQKARDREASLCGPECLAELLRRRGRAADGSVSVHALADEMHTGDRGTEMADLAAAANKRGFAARGLALTPKGLAAQTLPVIALVTPGHYVLVDAVSAQGVTVWDPDARGPGRGGAVSVPAAQWGREWRGITLTLSPPLSVRTARR